MAHNSPPALSTIGQGMKKGASKILKAVAGVVFPETQSVMGEATDDSLPVHRGTNQSNLLPSSGENN